MAKVPNLVVVLLCIIGAGALVTAFAAFGKSMFSKDQTETNFNQRSPEQDTYLSRVREINRLAIWGTARAQRREDRRNRDRDASDVEIQSGRSYSNVDGPAGYSQRNSGYHGQGYSNAPVYYEEEYNGRDNASHVYEEQQRPYTGGQGNLYANHPSKYGPTETWNEVPR